MKQPPETTATTTVTVDQVSYKAAVRSAYDHLHAANEAVAAANARLGGADDKIVRAIKRTTKRLAKAERVAHKRLRRADARMYGDREADSS